MRRPGSQGCGLEWAAVASGWALSLGGHGPSSREPGQGLQSPEARAWHAVSAISERRPVPDPVSSPACLQTTCCSRWLSQESVV